MEGLSGAQFIRKEDFEGVAAGLKNPPEEIVWLNAADPMQPFGKFLPHVQGRSFTNVPGTVAAFQNGRPAALFERQGKTLRVFETEGLHELLCLFAKDYRNGRIYAGKKRIVVADYPEEAALAFAGSGFVREMQDYVLYR